MPNVAEMRMAGACCSFDGKTLAVRADPIVVRAGRFSAILRGVKFLRRVVAGLQ